MVFDWFGGRNQDVAELIARKRYGKAIEVMRAQFRERPPEMRTRLQFVDVLILAGRGPEAIPVLMGLSDEHATEGEFAKAIALLKRVEQIAPERADVGQKLAALVAREFGAVATARGRVSGAPSRRLDFDLEEIPEDPPPEFAAAAAASPAAPEDPGESAESRAEELEVAAPAEKASGDEADATVAAPPASPEEPVAGPPTQDEAMPSPQSEEPAAAAPPNPGAEAPVLEGAPDSLEPAAEAADLPEPPAGVAQQIRGAFRRFLSSLPGTEGQPAELTPLRDDLPQEAEHDFAVEPEIDAEQTPLELDADQELVLAQEDLEIQPDEDTEPPQPPAPAQLAGPEPEIELEVEPDQEREIDAEPETFAEPDPEIEADAELELEAEPRLAAEDGATLEPDEEVEPKMSEEAFQGQVLDLIEEIVQQPPSPAHGEAGPAEAPVRTRGVAESAQRLLASPLFKGLEEPELLAVVRGMRLHTCEAGDIVISEGEQGDSLFVVTSGSVRMFVRNPTGHNFEVGQLAEGNFFGELSSLSGRPRTGTAVATSHTELLELDKRTVEDIARTHPHVLEMLESVYIQRASSPEAAAIRTVRVDPASRERAIEVLEAYFGESRWDPRMRLRLADLLVKAGKQEEAVPLLVSLAHELDRAGFPEKAIAILKKIERIRKRNIEEVNLAPLRRQRPKQEATLEPPVRMPEPPPASENRRPETALHFSQWLVDVVRDAVAPATSEAGKPSLLPGYARGLLASPLLEGLSEDELYSVTRELRLLSFDPGDIILSEGEPGQSVFILTAGAVKVWVKSGDGPNVRLAELRPSSFFGEMATVSGRPRSATVTAAQPTELLELDKAALDKIAARHPRVREVLEEIYIERATSPEAVRARSRRPLA